jgi:hypothetical protein
MNHPERTRGVLCVFLCSAIVALLGVLAAFPAPAAAAKKNDKDKEVDLAPPPVVIKFLGSQKVRVQGKEVLVVSGVTAMGGKQVTLPIPNKEKDKYTPNERMEEVAKQLKPGDYAVTETKTEEYNKVWLSKFEPYKATAGEEQQNNFIFQDTYPQKDGDKEVQVVALYKFGNYVDTVLPTRKDESSKQMVTDPDMLATVGKFKKGDIVEAEIRPGKPPVVQSIDPYKPAEEAKMGKMTEADVAEGVKGPAVELDQGGKPVTLLIPGKMAGQKWVPDLKLAGLAKGFKPGAAILVKSREAGGKMYLKEIKAAPKAPVAAKEKEPVASKPPVRGKTPPAGKEKDPEMKEKGK